ncbi:MAG: hemolysin family protein [Candidatus Omnitrophota bacterium]
MITLYTILIFAALALQAFFTASEVALTCVNRAKLRHLASSGGKYALKLEKFLKKEGVYLGTTLVGTNVCMVVASILATRVFAEHFTPTAAITLATLVMTPLVLIFAEIIPKMIAQQFSTALALIVITPLTGFFRLFYPLVVLVNAAARSILAPFRKHITARSVTPTRSDLKKALLLGYEAGGMEADEVTLIHKVLDFGSKKAEEIMVPIEEVSSISSNTTTGVIKKLAARTGFSRFPVYETDVKNIIGIVNIYDILFRTTGSDDNVRIKSFIRNLVRVDRNDGLDIGLMRLRHKKQPMGVVTGNTGNIVGIVTIEDMLEEIVGEIEDSK